jgi:hypothetical protein
MLTRRRLAALILPGVLLAALTGVPAGGAAAAGPHGPDDKGWTPPSQDVLRSGPRGSDLRAVGLLDPQPRPPAGAAPRSPARASTVTAGYADTCHDSADSPLDLREVAVTDDSVGDAFTITLTSCTLWDGLDLGSDGSVDIPLAVPAGRGDGPDYAIVITADDAGVLELSVLRTPSDDPATWELAHRTTMMRPDDFTAKATFPRAALGSPSEFIFAATSVDGEGREDLLPEAYADVLAYPFACSLQVQQAATVLVDPAQSDRLTGLARARGATVKSAPAAAAASAGSASGSATASVLSLEQASDATLEALRRAPGVRSAQRAVVYRRMAVPNDPGYAQQWYLPAVGAPSAWDVRTGSGLTMAVLDDGVDGMRTDLSGKVLPGRDTVYDVPLAVDSDLGGHGTAVSGLAAAQTDNAGEVAALDWGAKVLPFRVFDAAGCATDGAVVTALYQAADSGASVANLSLGGPGSSGALERAVKDVTARGMLVVAASGNSRGVDDQPNFPAAYDEVLAVGATTRSGELAGYSSGGSHLDITAPGGDGSGTSVGDLLVLGERGGLDAQAGTSFAAPLVAGAALLFRAQNPRLSPAEVSAAIGRSAVDAGPPGRDPDFGDGRLDLDALLRLAVAAPRPTEQACPPQRVPDAGFPDVPANAAHADNIDCVVWWEVANGTGNGYGPALSVNRAQMASFLARLVLRTGGELPNDPPDRFADDNGSVHELRINQLAAIGVVSGRDGAYLPLEPVTRAQMATFLTRTYEARSAQQLPPAADYFADDAGNVHEPRINQAAAAGFTGGAGNGGYNPAVPVRRDQMATFLARVLDRLVDEDFANPPGR